MNIDKQLLDNLTAQAQVSPRLRMNLDVMNSDADSSQRMLNPFEPGIAVYPSLLYTMTLEQMLESIGEPVKNWRKKNKN